MRALVFLLAFLAVHLGINAQTIEPQALAAAGEAVSVSGSMLQWTMGEPFVASYTASGTMLTEGFNQPGLIVTAQDENEIISSEILVYPIPASGEIHIYMKDAARAKLIDLQGRQIMDGISIKADVEKSIDLSRLAQGVYFLQILHPAGNIIRTFKIEKVSN